MLRLFKVFAEIAGLAMIACLLLIVATLFLELIEIIGIKNLDAVSKPIAPLLAPFLEMVRDTFGNHQISFQGSLKWLKIDMAYNILLTILVILFIGLYYFSGLLHRLDTASVEGWRKLSHSRFMAGKKKQLENSPTVLGKEGSCLVALRFDNIAEYPKMVQEINRALSFSAQVFSDQEKSLLKFAATSDALHFVLSFRNEFKRIRKETRVMLGKDPEYRIVLHSLEPLQSINEDETFVWAILTCMNPFQIYLSDSAKAQLDKQMKSVYFPVQFQIAQAGTFARLGNRTFPEVYRLDIIDTSFGQEGGRRFS